MKASSLGHYLKDFFEREKKSLLKNYPGLTLHRLREDLKWYAVLQGLGAQDLLEAAYLPHQNHPLTLFFEKLQKGTPLEYIVGFRHFYKAFFKVTEDVLIPRSETEILVELATLEIQKKYKNKKCRVLDVGTGTGAIALSLMMDDCAHLAVTASDISEKALAVARENFFNLSYMFSKKHTLSFVTSDRLDSIQGPFDLILSNPPYIKREADLDQVHPQVRKWEPSLALFLKDEEYDAWFCHFFEQIYQSLSENGLSLVEGHENHLNHLADLARSLKFKKVQVIKDYTERDRFLRLEN